MVMAHQVSWTGLMKTMRTCASKMGIACALGVHFAGGHRETTKDFAHAIAEQKKAIGYHTMHTR